MTLKKISAEGQGDRIVVTRCAYCDKELRKEITYAYHMTECPLMVETIEQTLKEHRENGTRRHHFTTRS